MRLWSIWNLISSFLYFVGVIFGWVLCALILSVFIPTFYAVLLGVCFAAGISIGIVGNVQTLRQRKRDAVDKELQDMAAGRSPDSHLNG